MGLWVLDTRKPLPSRVQEQFARLHRAIVAGWHAQPQLLPQDEMVLEIPALVQEQFLAEHATGMYLGGLKSTGADEFVPLDTLE